MSSFKRRAPAKPLSTSTNDKPLPPSTDLPYTIDRDQASETSLLTGLSSIDDLLGLNGLPRGHTLLIRTPDPHSAWGPMLSRYSIAQGLISGDTIIIVAQENDSEELISGCMWTSDAITEATIDTGGIDPEIQPDKEMKIAWRYEKMKQFSTTVLKRFASGGAEQESAAFDLTLRLPDDITTRSRNIGQLVNVPLSQTLQPQSSTCDAVIGYLRKIIQELGHVNPDASTRRAIRVIIPDLGSPTWGDLESSQLIRFLLALRGILRGTPAAAFITLSSTTSEDSWGGHDWAGKLAHVSDGCITLTGFGNDPISALSFPNHHGLVKVSSTPAPGTLRAPSITRSLLRGMTSSGTHGGGENNLAFRCTRRRLVIETMHLGAEGGIGARQTTAPEGLDVPVETVTSPTPTQPPESTKTARVTIAFDEPAPIVGASETSSKEIKNTRAKQKRVLFQADKPEIYDF
ncbi:Paxneb domain containing protein [Ceratobasidium theobromae]|uniref:Elongator complex protein 4 n=1 Tax=Ceratobasidium theobromae TaxID=1582974 RepID=A0A5N5QL18_9AGAM|nr:Paxneb domain containing protein [Ceratobasidium theobromae]